MGSQELTFSHGGYNPLAAPRLCSIKLFTDREKRRQSDGHLGGEGKGGSESMEEKSPEGFGKMDGERTHGRWRVKSAVEEYPSTME